MGPNGTGHRSTAEIIQDTVSSLGEILRSEIRLARMEMAGKARAMGKAAGLFGAGVAVLAVAGLLLVVTCVAALALVMPVWLACLIMGGTLAIAGGFMVLVGRQRLRQVDPRPSTTIHSIKEDVEWLRQSIK